MLLERTAAAFGRTDRGWHILYITLDSGIINPLTEDVSGGKVLAYDTWGVDVYRPNTCCQQQDHKKEKEKGHG